MAMANGSRMDGLNAALEGRDQEEREATANRQHPHSLPLHDSGAVETIIAVSARCVGGASRPVDVCELGGTCAPLAHLPHAVLRFCAQRA